MRGPLLFDLDGCLVDSAAVIGACIDHALAHVAGLPPAEPAARRAAVGPPLVTTFERLLAAGGADPALVGDCLDAYRDRFAEVAHRDTLVVPGVPAVLDVLAADATLAVVTSKPRPIAVPLLAAVGLLDRFAAVHGPAADHAVEVKATTLGRALGHLAVADASRAVMIGDRSHDVAAGRANGTRTVGVTWGAGDRAELEAAGADAVVTAPAELVVVLAALEHHDVAGGGRPTAGGHRPGSAPSPTTPESRDVAGHAGGTDDGRHG